MRNPSSSPVGVSVSPPALGVADLPRPGEFPELLADKLLDEVQQCAAYVPPEQMVLFEWALYNLAARLLDRGDPPADIAALDARIRRALFLVVERMVMLFPNYRRHIGAMLRAFITLVDEQVILVGVKPLPPIGGEP